MKTYKSEIGLGIALPLIIALGTPSLLFIIQGLWIPLVFIIVIDAFVLHMLVTTYYVLEAGNLNIYCGFLYRKTLPVSSISRIEDSNNLNNGPATSLKRLEIFYNRFDSVLVSPVNRREFIDDLLALNSLITIKGEV